jgi:hypothetical protein
MELRFQHGHLLLLTASSDRKSTDVSVLTRDGTPLWRTTARPPAEGGFRSITVRDASLAADGRVLLSVSLGKPLGESRNGLLEVLPGGSAPLFHDLDGLICHKILAEGRGCWCLGVDLGKLVRRLPMDVLFWLGPEYATLPLLPLDRLGVRPRPQGGFTGPWSASDVGPPMLTRGASSQAWVWMPNVDALARADLNTGQVETWKTPLPRAGRSYVSVGATAAGRLFGLFPLRGREEAAEALDTRYGFFERDFESGHWRLIPRLGDAPRGAQIAGVDGEALVLWLRAERRVEWRVP